MYRKFRGLDLGPFVYYLGFVCLDLNEWSNQFSTEIYTMIFTGKNKKPIATSGIVKTNAFQQIGTIKYNMFDAAKVKNCSNCNGIK